MQEIIFMIKYFRGDIFDVDFEIGEYKFVWDEEKAKINWKKHKVRFEDAVLVFFDNNRYDDYDEFHSDFEDRIKTVGKINGILAVIYTERGDRNRIISARQADKDEEEQYYEQFYY